MKRNYNGAFTLTEILVALSVIGVVAATIIPLANKYKPDEDKVKYLQTYDSISHVIKHMAQNQEAFPPILEEEGMRYDISEIPFMRSGMSFCQNFVGGLNVARTVQACETNGVRTTAEVILKNGAVVKIDATRDLHMGHAEFLAEVHTYLDGDSSSAEKHHVLSVAPSGRILIGSIDYKENESDNYKRTLYYHGTRAYWRKSDFRKEDWDGTPIFPQEEVMFQLSVIPEGNENDPAAWEPVADPVGDDGEDSASDSASDSGAGNGEESDSDTGDNGDNGDTIIGGIGDIGDNQKSSACDYENDPSRCS